jgi:hypothetical protein
MQLKLLRSEKINRFQPGRIEGERSKSCLMGAPPSRSPPAAAPMVGVEAWIIDGFHKPADSTPLKRHELGHHHLGDDRIRLLHAGAGACAGLVAAT